MNYRFSLLGLVSGGVLTVFIWLLSAWNIFEVPNLMLYDGLSRLAPPAVPDARRSLLIEVTPEQACAGDEIWNNALRQLSRLQAEQVLFLFLPGNASDAFLRDAAGRGNIFFGRTGLPCGEGQPSPEARFQSLHLPGGAAAIPPATAGVYRRQYLALPGHEKESRHLVALAAEARLGAPPASANSFLVNFNGRRPHDQPHTTLSRLLAGKLVQELIQGRSVIIGLDAGPEAGGFFTPLDTRQEPLSLLAYTGYSLDTLLTETSISALGPAASLLLLVLCVYLGIFAYQFMNVPLMFAASFLFLLLCGLASWFALGTLHLVLPYSELALTQLCLLPLLFVRKTALQNQTAKELLLNSVKVPEITLSTVDFYNSPEYWSQVINMVYQTLDLQRTIFLEAQPNKVHVKEVIALYCSITCILERRRDYNRTPYTTALRKGGMLKVDDFLIHAEKEGEQYLVPLSFAGQLQGFWAFSVAPEVIAAQPVFETIVSSFADEIAGMLYRRRQWQTEQRRAANPVLRLLNLAAWKESLTEIQEIMHYLERRNTVLDEVFNTLQTATILYDIFGRVVQINQKMTTLLSDSDILPYESTAFDLICNLTQVNSLQLRQSLSNLIMLQQPFVLRTIPFPGHEFDSMLVVTPLLRKEQFMSAEEYQPFHLRGMLLEIIDKSDLERIQRLKENLFTHSYESLKHFRPSVARLCKKLSAPDLDEKTRNKLVRHLTLRTETMFEYLERLNVYIHKDILADADQLFPVDVVQLVNSAITQLAETTARKQIRVTVKAPEHEPLALASPERLQKALANMLAVLIEDAVEQSEISVQLSRNNEIVAMELRNVGFGIPDNIFQLYLAGKQPKASGELSELRQSNLAIQECYGEFHGASEVGKGTLFSIILNRYR